MSINRLLKIYFSHIDLIKNCSITHRKSDGYDIPEEKFRLSKSFFNSLLKEHPRLRSVSTSPPNGGHALTFRDS